MAAPKPLPPTKGMRSAPAAKPASFSLGKSSPSKGMRSAPKPLGIVSKGGRGKAAAKAGFTAALGKSSGGTRTTRSAPVAAKPVASKRPAPKAAPARQAAKAVTKRAKAAPAKGMAMGSVMGQMKKSLAPGRRTPATESLSQKFQGGKGNGRAVGVAPRMGPQPSPAGVAGGKAGMSFRRGEHSTAPAPRGIPSQSRRSTSSGENPFQTAGRLAGDAVAGLGKSVGSIVGPTTGVSNAMKNRAPSILSKIGK